MGAIRTVAVKLTADVTTFIKSVGQSAAAVKGLVHEFDELGKKSPEKLNNVIQVAGATGLALLGVAGAAVKMSSEFETAMSGVAADTRATGVELERLRQTALQAGKDTQFSAVEAAEGIRELGKAGVSSSAIIGGGLKGALDLAAAGQISVAEAAETAAIAMKEFDLRGSDLPHLADLLAAGAGKAVGSVHDMGEALKQSGLVAAQFHLSITETTAALSAFASAGLIGSDAGTSLKTMLLALANPAKESAAMMRLYNIEAYDAQGNFVGLANLAGQLQNQLGKLTQKERDQALAQIFGNDAVRAANVLYTNGQSGIEGWINKVDDAGYASETAAKLTDNLQGDVERLGGSLSTLAIESGGGANRGLRTLAQSAEAVVDHISSLPGGVQQGIVVLTALSGAGLLAGAGMLKARQQVQQATEALTSMGPAGVKAARGLQLASRGATIAALAFAGLEVVNVIVDQFKEAYPPTVKLGQALREFAKSGKVGADGAKLFGDDLGKLHDDVSKVNDAGTLQKAASGWRDFAGGLKDFTGVAVFAAGDLNESTERVTEADKALADLVNRGRAQEAADVVAKLGLNAQEVGKVLPQYAAALGEVDAAASETAQSQSDAAAEARKVVSSFDDAYRAAKGLERAFDEMNGKALGLAEAENKLYESFDNAKEPIKASARTLDVHTEAGRKNREKLLGIAGATRDVLQAMQDSAAPLADINAKYQEARTAFINAAMAMGATRAEAVKLADQWMKMPTAYAPKVSTPGLAAAESRLNHVNNLLGEIDGKTSNARVTVLIQELHREESRQYRRWGGITEHAATGLLKDAGIYSPQGPARYAFAEPSTGGEAFVPKYGNYGRSMSILSQAARWYGAAVTPGGQQAAAVPQISPEMLGRAVARALQGMTVVMDGRTVGELTGRTADRYTRGG